MITHQEVELKFVLRESDYRALMEALGGETQLYCKEQRNLYFDTESGELQSKKIMLRVRFESGRSILTVKESARRQGALFSCKETEKEVEEESWEAELQKFIEPLELQAPLAQVGEMKNLRTAFSWNGLEILLDRTQVTPHRVDFELECETDKPDLANENLMNFFKELGIPVVEQKQSKYRRFLEANGILESDRGVV